jgi:HEAT repeat protein
MGEIGSTGTLDAARRLARDPSWAPKANTAINCGTIAASLKDLEGAAAARLLLLLRKDARFTAADSEVLSEATRLWSRRDPREYVDIHELAQPDPDQRAETAAFLGAAGIEEARAPLARIARNPAEPPAMRATAAEALGGLMLARGDLAEMLGELAQVENSEIARGAVRGLGRLHVRQSAEQLVGLLDGPLAADARAALAKLTGLAPDTDWAVWLKSPRCQLPWGT